MDFLTFQNAFSSFPVITTYDIEKEFPGYDLNALSRWQKKGYLMKIRNGYYRLVSNRITGNADLFFIANRIYQPSYVSLQAAFGWYGLVPEGVFQITSVSTRRTKSFDTGQGDFSYKNIKKEFFWGYRLIDFDKYRFKIANPSKAILDFFYLYPQYNGVDDMEELRLNSDRIAEIVQWETIESYLKLFASKALTQRIKNLKRYVELTRNPELLR